MYTIGNIASNNNINNKSAGISRGLNSIYKWFLHDEIIDDKMTTFKLQH
jgi:hypothetical protein